MKEECVELVFKNFKGRRTGLIKALTTDFEEFFQQCDPERGNLCLYGYPSGQWEVNLPVEEVPCDLPEPVLGINFARDGMQEKDWLFLIAVHSDAWLLAVSFFSGAKFGFDEADRKALFDMINELPTIFEVVTERLREESTVSNHSSDEHKPNSNLHAYSELQPKDADEGMDKEVEEEDGINEGMDEEEEEENDDTICGACEQNYALDEFWILCDFCERWQCVKITPESAEHIEQYKCPSCGKRAGA